jgi:hypothetical protein
MKGEQLIEGSNHKVPSLQLNIVFIPFLPGAQHQVGADAAREGAQSDGLPALHGVRPIVHGPTLALSAPAAACGAAPPPM